MHPATEKIHHAGPSTKRDPSPRISESARSTGGDRGALGSPVTRLARSAGGQEGDREEGRVEEQGERERDRERERQRDAVRLCEAQVKQKVGKKLKTSLICSR